ncbi:uncharacterized protein LOC134208959 [Armigeres subalbatus]|uniref:uncharacterized protein LOC134208959 n=1 Tax=Armigeres subalbatus TaxID=124917 RepID=UPI002ED1E5A4
MIWSSDLEDPEHHPEPGLTHLFEQIRGGLHLPKKKRGLGSKKTVFTQEQEQELTNHILDLEARFYGVNRKDIRKLAYELAELNGLPHNFNRKTKKAGTFWLLGYLRRNPTVSFRKPEATSAARARGFNKPSVNIFYDILGHHLETNRFQPSRIFNADETGISTVPPKKLKIAAKKGKKQVGAITSGERGILTTVVMCMSATGQHLPPYVIFPRVRMHDALKRGAPNGTKFNCNPSGYMTCESFLDYFDHFIDQVNPSEKNPALLIIDGHSSHTKNFGFTRKARANFVTVIALPPHCSNKLQPLDVAFMAPFKSYYASASEDFMRRNPGRVIGLYDVSELLGVAFPKAASVAVAENGFRKTGIWPFNRNVFSDEDFAPSEVTDQELTTTVTLITIRVTGNRIKCFAFTHILRTESEKNNKRCIPNEPHKI